MIYHYINDDFRAYNVISSYDQNDYTSRTYLEMRCLDRDQNESWLPVYTCENVPAAIKRVGEIEKMTRENIEIWFTKVKGYKLSLIERSKSGWKIVCKESLTFSGATRRDVMAAVEMWEQSQADHTLKAPTLPSILLPDASTPTGRSHVQPVEKSLQDSVFQGSDGDICLYDSIIHGLIEVVLIQINQVENWPVQTAQVWFFDNGKKQEVSARTKQLTNTGRKFTQEKALFLEFGAHQKRSA